MHKKVILFIIIVIDIHPKILGYWKISKNKNSFKLTHTQTLCVIIRQLPLKATPKKYWLTN